MDTIWLAPALLCYTLAAVGFIVEVTTGKPGKNVLALVFLGAGAGFHSLDLVTRGLRAGAIPVMNFPQSLSFLAWVTALTSIVLIARLRTGLIGAVVAPSVLIALAGASLMIQRNSALPSTLRSAWLPVHVTLAFLGEALFVMAASVSLVYLVYDSRLKAKRPFGTVRAMPSLERLDRLNYRLLGWGFALLSLAILSGALWAEATWGHFWSWEPRESWALVTWLLYAALLESRLTIGWRGRRAATLTIVVFGVLVGSYLGVNLVYPGKHGGSFG